MKSMLSSIQQVLSRNMEPSRWAYGVTSLVDLLINVWDSESLPTDMAVGEMLMMHKKGTKDDNGNYRALCLLPHAFKVIWLCILRRIMPHVELILPITQAGFRTSRGCRDSVCIFPCTVEWLLENNLPAFKAYIDFKAAFDSLSHDYLIYSLRKFSMPRKI